MDELAMSYEVWAGVEGGAGFGSMGEWVGTRIATDELSSPKGRILQIKERRKRWNFTERDARVHVTYTLQIPSNAVTQSLKAPGLSYSQSFLYKIYIKHKRSQTYLIVKVMY